MRGWLAEAINGLVGQEALEDKGDYRKRSGDVPQPPCGAQARPRALSRPVISFEPPMQGWLAEAINGLLCKEALEDKGDYRKRSGEVPDQTVGPRPVPQALSRLLTLFEPRTLGRLHETINVTA